jgi:hypothetical protein
LAIAIPTILFSFNSAAVGREKTITFNDQVVRILQNHCQECHHSSGTAPISFMTYEETRPWAKSIQKQVAGYKMPPWHLDPDVGTWKNDRRLTTEERKTILAWVEQGAPEGDPESLPEPRSFLPDWKRGDPDVVFELPEALVLPAGETSGTLSALIPTGFTEDRWIKGAEVRPGNPDMVHHILVFAPRFAALANRKEPEPILRSFITVYSPDRGHFDVGEGEGVLVPAGAVLSVQVHYVKEAEVEALETIRIGLTFADYVVRKRRYIGMVGTTDILVPAGEPNYERSAAQRVDQAITIDGVLPHMHYRGVSMKFSARFPRIADPVTLMNAPSYDYNWSVAYVPQKLIRIPAGTTLLADAVYDNSADNPINPDPTVDVPFGLGSYEEMMYTFYTYTKDAEVLEARDPLFGVELVDAK